METNDSKFDITEIFMAKADWNRCFYGIIKRSDDKNNLTVFGRIIVKNNIHDGFVIASACDQQYLGDKLDELVTMVLDKGLHFNQFKSFVNNDMIFSKN